MIEIPQLEGTCGLRCREAKKDWFLRARIKNNYLGNDNTKPLSIPCSLARINNDGFLDMGTDSIVFKINNSAVMKIYPNLSISYLLKYQQEIDRIRNENFNPIVVDNKEYFFEVVPIKHIVESPGKRHCVIGYSPFVSGLNYHQYLLEYYKNLMVILLQNLQILREHYPYFLLITTEKDCIILKIYI